MIATTATWPDAAITIALVIGATVVIVALFKWR